MSRLYNLMGMDGFWNAFNDLTIPVEYDGSLSFGQQVGNLYSMVKKLKEAVQTLADHANDYDDIIHQLQVESGQNANDIAVLKKTISDMNHELELEIAEIKKIVSDLDGDLSLAFKKMNEIISQVNILEASLNFHINNAKLEFAQFRNKIFEILEAMEEVLTYRIENVLASKSGNIILVKNPVNGNVETLNQTMDSIWTNFTHVFAITKHEYDSLKLTMAEYKTYNITAEEYRTQAKIILMPRLLYMQLLPVLDEYNNMITEIRKILYEQTLYKNPWNNMLETNKKIVQETINNLLCEFKAYAYRKAEITAGEYKEFALTKEEYRKYGFALAFIKKMVLYNFPDEYIYSFRGNHEKLTVYIKTEGELRQNRGIVFPTNTFDIYYADANNYVVSNGVQQNSCVNYNGYGTIQFTYDFKELEDGTYTYYDNALNIITINFLRKDENTWRQH